MVRSSLPSGDGCTATMTVPELWWCADQASEAVDRSNRRKQPSAYPAAQQGALPLLTTAAAVQGCWDWNSITALTCEAADVIADPIVIFSEGLRKGGRENSP